jgi:hypothetical protein
MSPDTRIKDIYGLGVGISTVFKLFGHFLFKGGQDYLHTTECSLTHAWNKNMYGLGVRISIIFRDIQLFPISGVGVDPRGHI